MFAAKVFLAVVLAPAVLFVVAAGVVVVADRVYRLLGRPDTPPLPSGRPPSLYDPWGEFNVPLYRDSDAPAPWEIEWLLMRDEELDGWVQR